MSLDRIGKSPGLLDAIEFKVTRPKELTLFSVNAGSENLETV
jgi:hypothetical protein